MIGYAELYHHKSNIIFSIIKIPFKTGSKNKIELFSYEFIGAKKVRFACSLQQKNQVKHSNDKLLRSIGYRLKQLREENGLTQEVVTDRTKVNVGLYEVGATNITIVILTVLCNFYNITLEEFFRGMDYDSGK